MNGLHNIPRPRTILLPRYIVGKLLYCRYTTVAVVSRHHRYLFDFQQIHRAPEPDVFYFFFVRI